MGLIRRVGGKSRIITFVSNTIREYVNKNVRCFVDVFAGTANVTFKLIQTNVIEAKSRMTIVINDIDSDITDLFITLQSDEKEIKERLKYAFYGRNYFKHYRRKYVNKEYKDQIDKAITFFILSNLSFGAKIETFGWSHDRNLASSFQIKIRSIEDYADLVQKCVIENLDFEKCIKNWDSPNTLFYCDPPYYNKEKYYNDFKLEDHERLFNCLKQIKGNALVSYYQNDIINNMYKNWHCKTHTGDLSLKRAKNTYRIKTKEIIYIKRESEGIQKELFL